MQEPSVFSLILKGDLPGEVIYKDEQCFVLLSIAPISPGHSLVIPNEQIDHIWDVDGPLYHHLFDVAKKVAGAINQVYDYKRVDLIVEGFEMPHAHVHVAGLNESITHMTHPPVQVSAEALKVEADKLRACL